MGELGGTRIDQQDKKLFTEKCKNNGNFLKNPFNQPLLFAAISYAFFSHILLIFAKVQTTTNTEHKYVLQNSTMRGYM